MEDTAILAKVDHTLLTPTASWEEIKQICDDAVLYHTASVCIPPAFVKQVKGYTQSCIPICTVIGFPNGYHTTAVKCFETEDAVKNGADEIDMVIHLGWVKEKKFSAVMEEINQVKQACGGKLLKVIIETCCLEEQEKIMLCDVVSSSNADFIKTSTGFSTHGATLDDIRLMRQHMKNGKKIKAAGGIRSFEDAKKMVEAGADRLGTSSLVKIMKTQQGA